MKECEDSIQNLRLIDNKWLITNFVRFRPAGEDGVGNGIYEATRCGHRMTHSLSVADTKPFVDAFDLHESFAAEASQACIDILPGGLKHSCLRVTELQFVIDARREVVD